MKIVLLDTKSHDRSQFHCEETSLTEYLQKQASHDIKKNLAACFVLLDGGEKLVKGYYTLSNGSLYREDVPEEHQKRIKTNYNVPATLLGRLARDITMKGTGAGEYLLLDALKRSFEVSQKSIASMAVIVDPINRSAHDFYAKYGFILLPDSGKMFLTMNAISKLFK